ncbi:MAG: AbrB/MazE/SpoVT family DNA-binding domain-containing protein [Terriglobia bacterium]
MKISQLTIKGQVTPPKELRERFSLQPGSRVAFEEEADGIKVRPVRGTILDWAGSLRSPEPGVSDSVIRLRVKRAVGARVGQELAHG